MAKIVRYLTLPSPKRRKTQIVEKSAADIALLDDQLNKLCCTRDRQLRAEDIRVVLMAEADHRLLYDSDCIVPVSVRIVPGARTSPDGKIQYVRHRKDTKALGQMLFGTMASGSGRQSFKMHSISDNRLMVSLVFCMRQSGGSGSRNECVGSEEEGSYPLSVHSLDGLAHCWRSSATATAPPDNFHPIPPRHRRSRQSSLHTDDDPGSDWDEGRVMSPPHRVYSSTRRSEALPRLSLQDDALSWLSARVVSSSWSSSSGGGRPVGLSLLVPGELRPFLMQHMPLVEAEMRRLQARISVAAADPQHFLLNAYQAQCELVQSLCILHNTPRLRRPAWLHLQKRPADAPFVADFCTSLALLIDTLDTKHTQFFLSKLLSAVLMYHMSWIASVAPPPTQQIEGSISIVPDECQRDGCNSHLAQLLEVSGCVGGANRSAKTLVTGGDALLMARLLHVLSYFIRCSAIQHKGEDPSIQLAHSICGEELADTTWHNHSTSLSQPIPAQESPQECSSSAVQASSWCSVDSSRCVGWQPGSGSLSASSSLSSSQMELSSSSVGLGQSLLAGPSIDYSPHFVLGGLVRLPSSSLDLARISEESATYYGEGGVASQLGGGRSSPPQAVVIIADCNDFSVRVLVDDGLSEMTSPAESVIAMLETFQDMHRLGGAAKLSMDMLEDDLAAILAKSISLVELVEGSCTSRSLSSDRVRSVIGCDHSDLRLLLNVAAVYCPQILTAVI